MSEPPSTAVPGQGVVSAPARGEHRAFVRVVHSINLLAFGALAASGFVILLAHPRLYWGETGYFNEPALIDLPLPVVLGHSGWGRSLHFLSAWVLVINGLVYIGAGLTSGHFRRFLPTREQLRPRGIGRDLREHLTLRVPASTLAGEYNLLQKLSYAAVVFALFPLILLTGITMSPAITASWPWLFDLFDGRQSARTIHFIVAALLVLFTVAHVLQAFLLIRNGYRPGMMAWRRFQEPGGR